MLSHLLLLGAAASNILATPTRRDTPAGGQDVSSLFVDEAPTYLRPYVISHYATAQGVVLGSQVYRFYVTGPSSNYAFTLMGTNAPPSSQLGVNPHHHRTHYENFFNFKGRLQVFAEPKDSGEQEMRTLTQHDYGSVTRNATHTFKILDPDTELTGVVVPGGFEKLFIEALGGTNITGPTHTPYIPAPADADASTGQGSPAQNSTSGSSFLEAYDVYAQPEFIAETNNTIYPSNATWHNGNNTLGEPGVPYFIANGWGPKYLNSENGYQIVQPLATPAQTLDTNFTLSILSINRKSENATAPEWNLPGSAAFQVLEGDLSIKIGDYPTVKLGDGDVAFIPGNVTYSYWSDVVFTKTLYVSSGFNGLDQKLIEGGEAWDYVVFPTE